MSNRIAEYRRQMLQRKANHLGVTVEQMMADGRRQADLSRRATELRFDRRSGWRAIACRAAATGRGWNVLEVLM